MLIKGCQEGKGTPRLTEVKCPNCGELVEVFVLMGGPVGKTGTLANDETCACGHILPLVALKRNITRHRITNPVPFLV